MARLLTFLSRTPRVLYALWLVVAMTQPAGAHACPVHDRAIVQALAAHGMAMHHAAERSSPGHHSAEQCHCLGDCFAGVATPLPSPRATLPAPPAMLAESAPSTYLEQPFEAPARLLPPATAPPTALLS